METIIFPDVEGLVITHLNSVLSNARVSTKVPDPRPARFVKVTAVGGTKRRINADSTMVTVQCWESDSIKASELARTARAHIHALAGQSVNDVWVYRVLDVGGPASSPDPNTDTPRYQFTVSIDVKGVTLNG